MGDMGHAPTDNPQISGTIVQNLVARVTRYPDFVTPGPVLFDII